VHHLNTIDSLLLALLSIQALISLLGKHLPNQRYSHVFGVTGLLTMGIPHAALVLYIMCIISIKEDQNSSVSEKKMSMSVKHSLQEQTLTE